MHALANQGNSGETSQALLQDVAIRLKGQQSRLKLLKNELNQGWEAATTLLESKTIIRAVNQPLSHWKDWNQHENRSKVLNDALKAIHNLQVLHNDTFQLSSDLLEQSHVFLQFNKAHQHLLKATMEEIRSRHASTVEVLADLTINTRPHYTIPTTLVDSFLSARLGIQLLCDHAVQLPKKPTGGISVDCPLDEVISDAVTEAKHMVEAHLPVVPEIIVPEYYPTLTVIRPWIHHALVELLKNSMAACVKRHRKTPRKLIVVEIEESAIAVMIHIHDQGPGVSNIPRAFAFACSGDPKRWDRLEEQQSYAMVRSPLSSLGVGLPLSRSMMRHFGGDLILNNRKEVGKLLDTGATASIILPKDDTVLERTVDDCL